MGKTPKVFLVPQSSPEGLIPLKEVKTNKDIPKHIEDTSQQVNEKLEEKISLEKRKAFEEIYKNFNSKNVFENPEIITLLKEIPGEIFDSFIDFCNFLIEKIQNAKTQKEISKIPQIISNLSSYKGEYKVRGLIKDKKNEVMGLYNKKVGKNNFLYKK